MLAAVDVGSNTARMLIGEVVDGKVKPHHYERKITRLKGGQNKEGLAPDAMERTLSALQGFIKVASGFNPDSILLVGTEALRSAANSRFFTDLVLQSIGKKLEIISGEKEAELSTSGALSVIDPPPDQSVIIDIGGGSTEIILTGSSKVLFSKSCPLGAVRLTEMASGQQARFIDQHVGDIKSQLVANGLLGLARDPSTKIIGTAGTITTLAAIDMEMIEYDWRRVNNYRLSAERIDSILSILSPLSPLERESVPGMEQGRGDLIIPGVSILKALMKSLIKQQLIVSDFGLLEGLLLEMSEPGAIH